MNDQPDFEHLAWMTDREARQVTIEEMQQDLGAFATLITALNGAEPDE